jgi:hypothetical protein
MLGFDRWQLLKTLSAILTIAGLVWLALAYLIPAPPSKITIATSQAGDHYQSSARAIKAPWRALTSRSNSASPTAQRKICGSSTTPIPASRSASCRAGSRMEKLAPDLLSLGRIDYQIFWLFYPTGETLTDLAQLKGTRIAMGPVDSGDRAVCEKILAAAGINYDNTTLLSTCRRIRRSSIRCCAARNTA